MSEGGEGVNEVGKGADKVGRGMGRVTDVNVERREVMGGVRRAWRGCGRWGGCGCGDEGCG